MIIFLLLALVIAILAVLFATQNTITVTVSLLTWKVTGSLSLILLITLALGVVIGLLVLSPSLIKNRFQLSGHRKRISLLEKELQESKSKTEPKGEAPRELVVTEETAATQDKRDS